MTSKDDVRNGLEKVKARYKELTATDELPRFHKKIQFIYPDVNLSYTMDLAEGEATIMEERVPRSDVLITMDSDTFLGIVNGDIDALTAFAAGKIKYRGAMVDLIKLQKLL